MPPRLDPGLVAPEYRKPLLLRPIFMFEGPVKTIALILFREPRGEFFDGQIDVQNPRS